MVVNNNQDAGISIGEVNRNIKDTVREFEKVVTGQEINYSSDDPSKYAASEKMRTKIRALEQNQQNAKAGMIMLTMAQEGIQEQLDILSTIKARALQAADATTTDDDRKWIQSEIEKGFRKIDDIAYEIEHNGINLLTGNVPIRETTVGWQLLLTPQVLEDSDLYIVDDVYFQLDGIEGPFDAFSRYQSVDTPSTSLLNGNSKVNLSGGTDGTAAQYEMDFSGKSVSDLVGKAFQIRAVNARGNLQNNYTNFAVVDSSRPYNTNGVNSGNVINITGLDKSGALNAIASTINGNYGSYLNATVNGDKIVFTSTNTQTESNGVLFGNYSTGDSYSGGVAGREAATATGLGLNGMKTSGGANATYKYIHHEAYKDDKDKFHPAWDEPVLDQPATTATMSFNISGAAAGSGITFNGRYFKFITDPSDPNYSNTTAGTGVTLVGLGYSGRITTGSFFMDFNNGQVTVTARGSGAAYNGFAIGDRGYNEVTAVPSTLTGHGLNALNAPTARTVDGVDGQRATYDMDLTAYDTTDPNQLESFIEELIVGSLHVNYKPQAYSNEQSIAYEFLDTKEPLALEALQRLNNSQQIDLNGLRTAVQGGKTIADAFIDMMTAKNSRFTKVTTDDGQKILRTTATSKGVYGNEDSLNTTADQLSHYTLDFRQWLTDNGSTALKNLPRYMDGKGFRFYCATDTEHWFNFVFTSGEDESDRPAGISGAHLETIPIDVSSLNSDALAGLSFDDIVSKLVDTIYSQANPYLKADDHNLYLAVSHEKGTITVYDERKEDVLDPSLRQYYPEVREMGAKIGDGVLDDVQKTTVQVPANQRQLAIQHTDYSAQNILLHIPQTTMNHIFALDPDWPDYSKFNITTQTGRDYLLGKTSSSNAALNKGLEYLYNALTTVSAQNAMLHYTEAHIFSNYENETAAESAIRDTDIAKAYVNFTKSNMLAKASYTMLAQANQNVAKVIELLDRSKPDDTDVDDKKADKQAADKKSADKKSATYGWLGTPTSQREKKTSTADKKSDKKTSAADKTSTDKKSADKKKTTYDRFGTPTTQRNKTSAKI